MLQDSFVLELFPGGTVSGG